MNSHYDLLQIRQDASTQEIKRAFRERAKQLHPDIAGEDGAEQMRKLLAAYETLSDKNRRFEYDKVYRRFAGKYGGKPGFNYRIYLRERQDEPESQAKLIFFELLHLEEETALALWEKRGGLNFPMEKYMDREDWMDCTFIIAEELNKRNKYYEAFILLVKLVKEERRLPYFKHFMEDVETFLKELIRLHLRKAVDPETYVECMETLLELKFPAKDEARWLRSLAEALISIGEMSSAAGILREALKRDPKLPNTVRLRKALQGVSSGGISAP